MAEVDKPVIVVTTVAIIITRTDRPLEKKKKKRDWECLHLYFNLPYLQLDSLIITYELPYFYPILNKSNLNYEKIDIKTTIFY